MFEVNDFKIMYCEMSDLLIEKVTKLIYFKLHGPKIICHCYNLFYKHTNVYMHGKVVVIKF